MINLLNLLNIHSFLNVGFLFVSNLFQSFE